MRLEVVPRNDLVLFSRLQIDFGRDFERQLDSYVDARSSFSNLETVLVMLVQVMLVLKITLFQVNSTH